MGLRKTVQPERRSNTDPTPDMSYLTMERPSDQCLAVEVSQAKEILGREQREGTAILYMDASGRNRISGCAVGMRSGRGPIETIQQATIGRASTCPIVSTEVQAIKQAIDCMVQVRS